MRIAALAALLWLALAHLPAHAQQRYWYDGDQRRALWSDAAWVADFTAQATEKGQVLKPAAMRKHDGDHASPVFRDGSEASSPRRALPGGVIVRFAASTPPAAREALIARHRLEPLRALGGAGDVWLMRSAPGLPSLELANRLYESGEFAAAAPNWWRPRALK